MTITTPPAPTPPVPTRRRRSGATVAVAVALAALAGACSTSSPERPAARSSTTTVRPGAGTTPTTAPTTPATQLLAVVADGLTAYDATPGGSSKRLLDRTADGLGDRAPTGQVCAVPAPDRRVAVGLAPAAPTDPPAWAIVAISGEQLDALSARVVGLVSAGAPGTAAPSGATPTGCTALGDGRLVTTDTSGRLAVWIPPLGTGSRSCTLVTGLAAPGQLGQDDQRRVYVTVGDGSDAGVFRIASPSVSAPDAAGGCGASDPTGLPQADRVRREPFLAAAPDGPARPQGIAIDQSGPVLVASPTPGPIVQTDANGTITRRITTSGRPLGLAVDPDGSLYVADPGDGSPTGGRLLVLPAGPDGLQPGVALVTGLDRPQSVTVLVAAGGGGASKL